MLISSSYEFKPSAIVSYSMGPTGGIGASLALRPHLSELGCIPIKHMVIIPQVLMVFSSYLFLAGTILKGGMGIEIHPLTSKICHLAWQK